MGFRVEGSGFCFEGLQFRLFFFFLKGCGFRVEDLDFRVEG